MSLSRVVKKPGNVIFNEIVQIKEKSSIENDEISILVEPDYDLGHQIIQDAHIKAEQMLMEMNEHINILKKQFDEECKASFNKIKEEAFVSGFEEGKSQFKHEAFLQLDKIEKDLIELEKEKFELIEIDLSQLQNKIYQIGLDIAKKILRHEINQDQSILKTMILDEIDIRKNQNIRMVEISKKAETLIFDLRNELEMRGINLQLSNDELDHIVIESDSGHYDLSICTQLKNIQRLFNTL